MYIVVVHHMDNASLMDATLNFSSFAIWWTRVIFLLFIDDDNDDDDGGGG